MGIFHETIGQAISDLEAGKVDNAKKELKMIYGDEVELFNDVKHLGQFLNSFQMDLEMASEEIEKGEYDKAKGLLNDSIRILDAIKRKLKGLLRGAIKLNR